MLLHQAFLIAFLFNSAIIILLILNSQLANWFSAELFDRNHLQYLPIYSTSKHSYSNSSHNNSIWQDISQWFAINTMAMVVSSQFHKYPIRWFHFQESIIICSSNIHSKCNNLSFSNSSSNNLNKLFFLEAINLLFLFQIKLPHCPLIPSVILFSSPWISTDR